ncbi:MAG: ATP synthase F0 subunit B [bacterium]|nr:ATP synthase F0 subunit B [bacterium]MBU1916848.1 ATP synthase F0 subunit B [bacterium]
MKNSNNFTAHLNDKFGLTLKKTHATFPRLMELLPDITIIYMWLLFALTLCVLHFLVFKPTLKIINKRYEKTQGLQKEAHEQQAQTELKKEEYEAFMEQTAQEGQTLREQIINQATKKKNDLIDQARKQAQDHLKKERASLENESKKAQKDLTQGTELLATQICDKLINQEVQ